jgi:hypothetical protein
VLPTSAEATAGSRKQLHPASVGRAVERAFLLCEQRSMQVRYIVFECGPDKPWLVIGVSHRTIERPNASEFTQQWPLSRFAVELDPRRLG